MGVLTYGFYWEVYHLSIKARNIAHKRVVGLALDPPSPTDFSALLTLCTTGSTGVIGHAVGERKFSFSAR